MPAFLVDHPGLIYVVATLLPLASFLLLLLLGGVRNALRKSPEGSGGEVVFRLLGGASPGRAPALIATGAIALAFVCSLFGFIWYVGEAHDNEHQIHHLREKQAKLTHKLDHEEDEKDRAVIAAELKEVKEKAESLEHRWEGSVTFIGVHPASANDRDQGTTLKLGYRIDHLSAIMFLMVTFIATLIHVFSMGYMADEMEPVVTDHDVHTAHGHLHRRGRFGRFFLFLSLFCFSMLNLLLADNLFQVFVSWELVGICSYLLIGYYYERQSASNAANKAFITNRVGDAGFIIGLLIVWTYFGSFNFQEIFSRVRSPAQAFSAAPGEHGKRVTLEYAHQVVRAELKQDPSTRWLVVVPPATPITFDTWAMLFPRDQSGGHFAGLGPKGKAQVFYYDSPGPEDYGGIPYWLLVAAGLGIFLGCIGKSAQFPLQVWLPDAMEGPTPVSALIHAATMVAAGVYLVGRCYPLFTAEVLLVIAYTGAITLFVAASIAVVMTDIKKVLAYSTVSQLGYMMLALGIGGWVAGLFHLITHAFFKALLFLCSGSVIYGCHHQQEMTKMGGLYPKMKITALTMLIGCLAIAGTPLFSGWYSKDAILAQAFGFGVVYQHHFLLFALPLISAGITAFYMFRMWFMTFTGKPRDQHVYDNAHESPRLMTVPLMVLAFFSVVVAWGWPVWDPEASALEQQIHHAMPPSVIAEFGGVAGVDFDMWNGPREPFLEREESVRHQAHHYHMLAGNLALGVAALGFIFAMLVYYYRVLDPTEARDQFPWVYAFLRAKWYFDELYSALLVRPALAVANWCASFDAKAIDGTVNATARATVNVSKGSGRFDLWIIDGLVNLLARVVWGVGSWLRGLQTGYIRSYVVFLVVAAVGIWVILSALLGPPVTR